MSNDISEIIDYDVILKNDYKELLISGISLMIIGTGVIIYGKKKKKK